MEVYWKTIIEPALRAVRPGCIVEIGCEKGLNTRNLLAYCEHADAVLHAIDPQPLFDVASWQRQYGSRFTMHAMTSLQALPTIDRFDVVLIDGDHNWFTVLHELRLIEKRTGELGQAFPLVLLHDIGWPYGRRDLYYNPADIPEASRQPYARKGLRPGMADLVPGGFNRLSFNALAENTPQNGVFTAIEDFLKETKQSLRLVEVPGFFGLGILYPAQLLERNERFARFLETWTLPAAVKEYIQQLETDRLQQLVARAELGAQARKRAE